MPLFPSSPFPVLLFFLLFGFGSAGDIALSSSLPHSQHHIKLPQVYLMTYVLLIFLGAAIKQPLPHGHKSSVRKEGFILTHSLKVSPIMAGIAWQ